ncbi:MAG TPA: alpha/beta family hydrolase, partial [Marinobacter sp.]
KSMGGRMASLMVAQAGFHPEIRGAVGFGYPFHAPGKPDRWRTGHFSDLERPLLIVQGTRDPFGRKAEVDERRLDNVGNVHIAWLNGGDHDFRPLVRQPESHDQMMRQAAGLAAAFMLSRR